jgi:hypothetical protein
MKNTRQDEVDGKTDSELPSNRVSFQPDSNAESANGSSTNGTASLRPGAAAKENRGSYAESASNRTSMASRASMLSRDISVEDILQKLLEEESDIPMNFPREQVRGAG